jgi:adenylate cyclase
LASTRVERRLAAILAADVVGYSRLTGADEEGTLSALKAHRRMTIDPKIGEYRGRIFKTTGDGLLVEFGSVVEAVRCAIEIQRAMVERNREVPENRQIEFRIGIHLGDVVIEGDDMLGDGVNVAARIEGIAQPGGLSLSDDAYRQVQGKVSAQFVDSGEQQLKNIGRPVRIYRVVSEGTGGGAKPALTPPEKPAIAVLPFDNMSDAAEDIYFADGIAEDIITELSRYPDLFVVARNSSFSYRGNAARVSDVGRDLGVHYVLEGSVRRAANRVRINAQLIDAATGKHLWAQRYDRSLEDVFSVQDEVTQSIVAVLPARIQAAAFEQASRKTTSSLDAYDHLLRGKFCHHLETPDANREAEAHFDRSIELDPRFASAYAWKACTIGQSFQFRPRTSERQERLIKLVEQAMSIDPNDTECHRIMCRVSLLQGQFAKSDHHLECALALNPNDPRLVVQRGINLTFLGDPEAAIPWIERAMRIDPFSAHRYYLDMVRALFMAGRCMEAVVVLERTARSHWEHYLWLAACCAASGKDSAARQAGREAMILRPDLSTAGYIDGWFIWKRSEDQARLRDALARAGLAP